MKITDGRQTGFVDRVKVFISAGDGGNGCLSFRREKFIPFGGPNGGDGGRGGSVYLISDRNLTTLLELSYHPHIKAAPGANGRGGNKTGSDSPDVIVSVPCGTIVKKDGKIIADMTDHGEQLLVAKGGKGGRGNLSFKSRFNTAPKIAEKGEKGDVFTLELELKVLADVGLLGFPNAGKSTFISVISSARPKVADYPFTTLSPSLGMVRHKNKSFVVADIPGIIEGAHEGRGLGIDFLKHIERTRVLVHLVDPEGFGDTSALASVKVIADELKSFNPKLALKPRVIVVNKSDLACAEEVFEKIKKRYRKAKVFLMSAITGKGASAVLDELVRMLESAPLMEIPQAVKSSRVVEHSIEPAFRVIREEDGVLKVTGKEVERIIHRTNFAQPQAVLRLASLFKRMGLDKALRRNGIVDGDIVRVCGSEFEWNPSMFDDAAVQDKPRRKKK